MSINELTNKVTMLDVVNTSGETAKNTNDIVAGNTSTFSSSLCSLGFPSSNYIDIENLLEKEGDVYHYTVPANGYIVFRMHRNNTSVRFQMYNDSTGMFDQPIPSSHSEYSIWMPFAKGQRMTLYGYNRNNFSQNDGWNIFRFVYAVGEDVSD